MPDTRSEILRIALQEFGRRGYAGTSVQRIADRVGITKAAVLYHFPEKSDLLVGLASPLLEALDALMKRATDLSPEAARWAVIEGMLDLNLGYRELIRLSLKDLALSAATFERYRDAMFRANELVAGPRPTFALQVRAAQAIAALGDPVVLFEGRPPAELRDEVLRGARLLLAGRSPAARPATARRRGRPLRIDAKTAALARTLHERGARPEEIARRIGVSRATAYRYIRDNFETK